MKSNKSINRRTHKNRLARARKTKRSNAKNVLKRSTKSQKGYRGGSNATTESNKCTKLLDALIKPGTSYSRKTSEELLKGDGIAVGTWLIRKSESNPDQNSYSLSVKYNNGVDAIAHLTINCNSDTNTIVIGEKATLQVDKNSTTETVINFINKVKVNVKSTEYNLVLPLYNPNQVPNQNTTNTTQPQNNATATNKQCNHAKTKLDELIKPSFTNNQEVEAALDDLYPGEWLIHKNKNKDVNFYVLSFKKDIETYFHIKITCVNNTIMLGATINPDNIVDGDTMHITDDTPLDNISSFIINNTIGNMGLKVSQYTPR